MNGWAVASLVSGVVGGVLLSVIFGVVALNQTKRSGERGRPLAVAGLVLSALWVVGFAVLLTIALVTGAERDPSGEIVQGGDVSAFDVQLGDCLNGLQDEAQVFRVDAVACTELHEGEVFALYDLPGGTYPGEAALASSAQTRCDAELAGYAPSLRDSDIELYYLHPTPESWRRGDREMVCVATRSSGPSTGSIRG